jgi:hypothetical protein
MTTSFVFARTWCTAIAVVSACLQVCAASGAPLTTAPGVAYQVPVLVTDRGIAIQDRLTRAGVTRFPRGSVINFLIRNASAHSQVVQLKLLSSHVFTQYEQNITVISAGKPIAPGGVRKLGINFYYRGLFALEVMRTARLPRAEARVSIS